MNIISTKTYFGLNHQKKDLEVIDGVYFEGDELFLGQFSTSEARNLNYPLL